MMAVAPAVGDLTVWSLLAMYLPVLIVAWGATLLATPIVRLFAIQFGIVDRPDEARKLHKRPIAYLGGLAVFIGVLAGVAVSDLLNVPLSFRPIPLTVVLGMILMTATGLGDDIWGWEPYWKVLGQVAAAAGLSLYGIGTQTAGAFLGYFFGTSEVGVECPLVLIVVPIGLGLLVWWYGMKELLERSRSTWFFWAMILAGVVGVAIFEPVAGFRDLILMPVPINVTEWVGVGIVAVLVLGGCNATNLIDGLDGLLSGTAAIIGAGLLVISLLMALHLTNADLERLADAMPAAEANADGVTLAGARIALCMALIGAMLGFLAFNFNPATIFLGDAGSLLIGYLCVTIILTLGELGHTHFVLAGLIVFGLPIVDTVLAIFRRKSQGLAASEPDANHLHHILKRILGTVKQAVLGMWVIEAMLAAIGVSIVAASIAGEARVLVTYVVFILLFSGVAIAGTLMGRRELRRRRE